MTQPDAPVRIAVTGLGAVTPVGLDVAATWAAFVDGTSGIGPITAFDAVGMGFASRNAGEVAGFDPAAWIDPRAARRMDRSTQFAIVAAREALADAGLLGEGGRVDPAQVAEERIGAYIGSGIGGIGSLMQAEHDLQTKGQRRVSPLAIPMTLTDSTPGAVAIEHGLKGPNMAHVSACASGANAIGEAAEAIRRGVADVMVAGGSEAAVVPVVVAGFQNMGALSKWQGEPHLASRPFDAERDGFVIGEGAGLLVLERWDRAMARGARIHAELAGYGSTCDAGHITAPSEDGDGILRAIHAALAQAGMTPADLAYINAHGTSTELNDKTETMAMKRLLGDRARAVPISSTKSMIGHLLGAGGAVEAIACCLALATGTIPPTINLHTPDPDCDLDYVPNAARTVPGGVPSALSNSLGFGGHNASLVFRRAAG